MDPLSFQKFQDPFLILRKYMYFECKTVENHCKRTQDTHVHKYVTVIKVYHARQGNNSQYTFSYPRLLVESQSFNVG